MHLSYVQHSLHSIVLVISSSSNQKRPSVGWKKNIQRSQINRNNPHPHPHLHPPLRPFLSFTVSTQGRNRKPRDTNPPDLFLIEPPYARLASPFFPQQTNPVVSLIRNNSPYLQRNQRNPNIFCVIVTYISAGPIDQYSVLATSFACISCETSI